MGETRERIPIRQAAKEIGRDYRRLRKLAMTRQIRSYKTGGTDESPWLEVYLDELRADLDRAERFEPVTTRRRHVYRARVSAVEHPAARAM